MRVHAIIAARNASHTLPALLNHLAGQGVTVTFVDHGSTDETWQIAQDFDRQTVTSLMHEPFDGVFDLTRQLALKAALFDSSDADWLMHLDADEFLLPPQGNLKAFLDRQPRPVISCREFMFLPASEEEVHEPSTFRDTMTNYMPFAPKNTKQRVFRRGIGLDLWRRTGGHTISRDPDEIAHETIPMAHYIGLSLDHIRTQYASRVFAQRDLEKGWHATRFARGLYVRAPEGLRNTHTDGLDHSNAGTASPFFATKELPQPKPIVESGDIVVSAHPCVAATELARRLDAELVEDGIERLLNDPRPIVTLLSDGQHAIRSGEDLAHCTEEWCNHTASLRQLALLRGSVHELRVEDFGDDLGFVVGAAAEKARCRSDALKRLPRYPKLELKQVLSPPDLDRFSKIAGDLMRDLGYHIVPKG